MLFDTNAIKHLISPSDIREKHLMSHIEIFSLSTRLLQKSPTNDEYKFANLIRKCRLIFKPPIEREPPSEEYVALMRSFQINKENQE